MYIICTQNYKKKDTMKGYLIANNKGYENEWTRIIYRKVVKIET